MEITYTFTASSGGLISVLLVYKTNARVFARAHTYMCAELLENR